MKKVYDWNVRLSIHIENNYKNIEIVCSVHSNIHQIKIEIAKSLGLLIFDTNIDLYYNSSRPLKPTSTLLQNGIQKNTIITAIVTRIKQNRQIDIEGTYKNPKNNDKNIDLFGLSVKCSCVNQNCMNFDQDLWINYGFGKFNIFDLISSLKCQLCPYRAQYLRPTMLCKQVLISKSVYKLDGTQTSLLGIPLSKQIGFKKTLKKKSIIKQLQTYKWNSNLLLTVKQI